MNLRRHKPGSWRLTWELGRDPVTGKRLRETRVVTGTKAEAARIWRERQAEIEAEIDRRARAAQDPGQQAVTTVLERWITEAVAPKRSPSTVENYRLMLTRFITPTLGPVPVAALSREQIEQAVAAWRTWTHVPRRRKHPDHPAPPRTVSASTVANAYRVLRAGLSWAVRQGWIPVNPARAVETPAPGPRLTRWWTAEDATRFLAATTGEWYWGAWALALTTGMRLGEILGLRWPDVDRAAGVLWIRQVRRRGAAVAFGPPKTLRSTRPVALDDAIRLILDHQAEIQAARRAVLGRDWPETALVITTPVGTPAAHRAVERAFTRAVRREGLPPIRFHDLRHTHGSLLRQAGADWRVIADRLGHSQVSFTAQVYLHADVAEQSAVAGPLNARLLSGDGHTNGHTPD
jgi:integrase